jgi:hypothetical protein
MPDEEDPSLLEHEHRTSIEVNMATTKVLGGVPVYNYHLANPGGMNPSLAELTEQKKWIIMMDAGTTDADEAKFCQDVKSLGNIQCIDSGDPDNNGEPYVAVKANEAELKSVMDQHFPHVLYGEPDGQVFVDDPEPDPSLIEEAASLPWGLDRIDDVTGQDGSYDPPAANSNQGAGAHVYVADTGVRISHDDFEGRAIAAFDYFKSGSDKVCHQGDANCAGDRNGHGTHCAGTIGGKQYGVAKKTALYAVKVLNPSGSYLGILKSVDYVMSKGNKPAVWSASLGGGGNYHAIADTFVKAKAANVLISVAAGNNNANACSYTPAFAPAAITVGATQSGDKRASFSNYGSCVDIFAPGVAVKSAWWNSNTATRTISGTSMACPHVSGVAALIYGDFPGVTADNVEQRIKTDAGKGLVKDPKSTNLMLHVPKWVPDSGSGTTMQPTVAPTVPPTQPPTMPPTQPPTKPTMPPQPPTKPPPTSLVPGMKEEVWYKKYGMRRLPTSWSSPSFTRGVSKIDYRSTGSPWSGLTERDNFAVRWTGEVKLDAGGRYEWCTRSDDGSKMIIDGSLIVNNDGLHGMRMRCGWKTSGVGYNKFEAQMFERGGGAGMEVYYSGPDTSNRRTKISASKFFFDGKVPTTTTPPPPTAPPPPPSYVVAGLKEEVWYKKYGMRKLPTSWSSPSFTRKIAKIDYRSTGRPWSGLKERDNFAVRWTGYVKIATAGEYTWYTTSDDGSKLLIDGQKVVDNDGLHGMRTKSGKGQLLVGYHMFEAQMFERGGGAGMYVYYRGPGMGYRQKVPSSKYFMLGPPTTTTAPPTTTTQDDPISGDDGDMGDGDLN